MGVHLLRSHTRGAVARCQDPGPQGGSCGAVSIPGGFAALPHIGAGWRGALCLHVSRPWTAPCPRGGGAHHIGQLPRGQKPAALGVGDPGPRLREERASPSAGTDVSGFMQIRNCPLAPRAPTLWWEPSMGSSWLEGSTSLKESHTKSQNEFFFLEFSYHFSALSSSPHKGKKPQK